MRLVVTKRARDDILSLNDGDREAVLATMVAIQAEPRGVGKPLVGRLRGTWSARVGLYRVLYTLSKQVVVRTVLHRSGAYRTRRARRRR